MAIIAIYHIWVCVCVRCVAIWMHDRNRLFFNTDDILFKIKIGKELLRGSTYFMETSDKHTTGSSFEFNQFISPICLPCTPDNCLEDVLKQTMKDGVPLINNDQTSQEKCEVQSKLKETIKLFMIPWLKKYCLEKYLTEVSRTKRVIVSGFGVLGARSLMSRREYILPTDMKEIPLRVKSDQE